MWIVYDRVEEGLFAELEEYMGESMFNELVMDYRIMRKLPFQHVSKRKHILCRKNICFVNIYFQMKDFIEIIYVVAGVP